MLIGLWVSVDLLPFPYAEPLTLAPILVEEFFETVDQITDNAQTFS